jgi:hypothetical protein
MGVAGLACIAGRYGLWMDLGVVLIIALVALGVSVYAAVKRRAVLAAVSAVVSVGGLLVWAGETFGFLNL